MARAMRVCSKVGCPVLVPSGRCAAHLHEANKRRGSAAGRGYGHQHRGRFRPGVLKRDPLCVCVERHGHHANQCLLPSTVADHWPLGRDELVLQGLDPNDPAHGRGLCKACHDWHTSQAQPGGWHADYFA